MLNRRQFLLGVGSGVSLLGMGAVVGCTRSRGAAPLLVTPDEEWANAICQLCPSACGLRLRLVNGHPVTVGGNPLHPVNRGGLCARGAASLQLYYDPDRIAGPLRRDPGVIGGWAPTTWPDALGEVGARLRAAIEAGPGRIAVIRTGGYDIASELFGRLAVAADSPWIVDVRTPVEEANDEVVERMHGLQGELVPDLGGSDFVLSLDSGLLEASPRTMMLHRGFADMRSAGGRFVHAGPCLGVTGSKADAWLPMRPGTVAVLALGIAHMLIKEGYARNQFLREHVVGFDDWVDEAGRQHEGIRSWLLHEFSPHRVADLTGLESADVIRVARGLGSAERPLAVGPVNGAGSAPLADVMAVHTLNVVLGAIDVPGGVLFARRPPIETLDRERGAGRRRLADLVDWVLAARTPPIDVCFIHDADPVFASGDADRVAEALRRIPLVVSTSPVPTDTVAAADVVLPDALWLERASDAHAVDGGGRPVVSLTGAAATGLADSKHAADVVLGLAASVGGTVARRFTWASYDEIVQRRVTELFESGVGDMFTSVHRSVWTQLLERSGWRASSYATRDELARSLDQRGGWWDPAYHHGEWRRIVGRPDRRIDLGPVRQLGTLEPTGETAEDALLLYVSVDVALDTRIGGSLPYLQDCGSPLFEAGWVTGAGLNPRTAARHGVVHGATIRVRNPRGEIRARAYVSPAIRPDVLVVHAGGGRGHGGRWAAGVGSNPLTLVAPGEPGPASATIVPVEEA